MFNFLGDHQFNRGLLVGGALIIFTFGLYLGEKLASESCRKNSYSVLAPSVNQGRLPEIEEPLVLDKVFSFSEKEFACNAQLAFEELSRLHAKRLNLDAHSKRGDANRDRTATITRKAVAADAAENAFRGCLNRMMPELLKFWDEKNSKGQLKRHWDEEKERNIVGITFEVMEQSALELEDSILSKY